MCYVNKIRVWPEFPKDIDLGDGFRLHFMEKGSLNGTAIYCLEYENPDLLKASEEYLKESRRVHVNGNTKGGQTYLREAVKAIIDYLKNQSLSEKARKDG